MSYAVVSKDPPPEDEDNAETIFDQTPVRVVCPHCGKNIITFIEHESSWVTYFVSIILMFVLQWASLCVVPVVFPLFKDVVHHCPRCLSVLATRSRVVWPSFKQEVMSFRFGSCVIVLARKYVFVLIALVSTIGGVHYIRSGAGATSNPDVWEHGPTIGATWDDFRKDCGFKSYLGNPIHVGVAFEDKFKNRTINWEGTVDRTEGRIDFLWVTQPGAVFVRMGPPQFPTKDVADLVLLYKSGGDLEQAAQKLSRGDSIAFEASLMDVGKRGAPHVLAVWKLDKKQKEKNIEEIKPSPAGEV